MLLFNPTTIPHTNIRDGAKGYPTNAPYEISGPSIFKEASCSFLLIQGSSKLKVPCTWGFIRLLFTNPGRGGMRWIGCGGVLTSNPDLI